jgi:hypothetical protein
MDADGHALAPELRHQSAGATDVVTIEDNVWIGSRAIILKGVTLGAGCVVGRRLSRHPFGAAAYGRGREPGTPYPHALIYHEPLLSS